MSVATLHAQNATQNGLASGIPHSNTHQLDQSKPTYVKTANGFPIVLPRLSGDSTQTITDANPIEPSPSVAPIQHNPPFLSPTLAYTPPENVDKETVGQESIQSDIISESIQVEAISVANNNANNVDEAPPQQIAATPTTVPSTSLQPIADPPTTTPQSTAPSPSTAAPSTPTSAPSPEHQVQSGGIEWDEAGYASWYGGKFQGRQTANGEVFDTNKLTAAHKTLPFNSMVQVYNPTTQQSVLVRINDRGPFVESRIIDLSRAAASVIGLTSQGISQVYIRVVSEGVSQDLKLIQLGSFGVYENAVDLKTELEQAGIKVEIESGANSIYRVIVPDLTADELLVMRTRLADIGYSDVLVRSVK